jgi:putative transposase
MKRSKFSEEPIVYALRQAESGTPVGDLTWQLRQ